MADPTVFPPFLSSTSPSTSPSSASSSRSTSPASSSRSSSALTLSGDTPCPSRPLSILDKDEWDAPTRVGSPAPSVCGDDKKPALGDIEKGEDEGPSVVVDEFPEGGLRAWLCVAGSTLVLMVTFGFSNSFGAFMSHYATVRRAPSSCSTVSPDLP